MFWLGRRVMRFCMWDTRSAVTLRSHDLTEGCAWKLPCVCVWEWVRQCLRVRVYFWFLLLIISSHLNHPHTQTVTHELLDVSLPLSVCLSHHICPHVKTPLLLTVLVNKVTSVCVFSVLITTLGNKHITAVTFSYVANENM